MGLNIILFIIMMIFDCTYIFTEELLFKTIASTMFVSLGLINFIQCFKNKKDLEFPIWMLTALIYAMVGDVLLGLHFSIGVIVFGIAHIFYIISYSKLNSFIPRDFFNAAIISIIIPLPIIFILLDTVYINISLVILGCIYVVILSGMLGKAISNLVRERNSVNITITIGALLFFISDMCLILNMFGGISFCRYICLITYYLAQFLLSFSLLKFSYVEEISEKNI